VIYLDHNATTPVRPEVAEAISRATLEYPGNPSSVHAWGRRARDAVEQARAQVAELMGAMPEEVVFTSGGTEGDNLAIRGLCLGASLPPGTRNHLVTSPLEHPAVGGALEAVSQGQPGRWTLTTLPVGPDGELELVDLASALRDETALVTLALANHEIGTVYPVARFAELARARGALVHTDAVQAAGKIPLDVSALGVDAATISAHKIGGPKGVGAVFVRRGVDLQPLVAGGHQERERRPGTENVAGIVGFGVACGLAHSRLHDANQHFERLRQELLLMLGQGPGCPCAGRGRIAGRNACQTPSRWSSRARRVSWWPSVWISTGSACPREPPAPRDRSARLRCCGRSVSIRPRPAREFGSAWDGPPHRRDIDALGRVLPEIVARVRAATTTTPTTPTKMEGPAW
jgi:cysteine desulfurase